MVSPGGFLVGVCRLVLQILTLLQTHLFSDPAFRQKLCHNYLDKSAKKIASNAFHIRIFLFLSYSFGIETINTFKGFLSFLENHT